MRIQHNISALNTHRNLSFNNTQTSKALEKLSSGYKINRAGDDAAGLAISEKMRGQIRGLDMASKNAQDGISLIQTAEGALNETHSILQRMRELAVQAGNDTNTTGDREEIQKEINQLTSEINRIGNTTEFNTKKLVNGEFSDKVKVAGSDAVTATTLQANTASYTIGENSVSWSSGGKPVTGSGATVNISGSATNSLNWSALDTTTSGVKNEIKITKDASGQMLVSISATDAVARSINLSDETMTADASGNMSFNMDGVSFSLTKEQVANWTNGTSATTKLEADATAQTIDLASNAISLGKETGTVANASGGVPIVAATVVSGFAIGSGFPKNVDEVKLSFASGKVTVELLNGGNSVQKTDYTADELASGEGRQFKYDQNGLKFDFDIAGGITAVGETSIKLKTTATTKTITDAVEDSTKDASVKFQIGANKDQAISVSLEDMRSSALGITTSGTDAKFGVTDGTDSEIKEQSLNVLSHEEAAKAIKTFDEAITKVSAERSKLGAVQNRLEHTINNLGTSSENLTAAESRIRDTDMAASMMEFTKNNILTQAAQSMLAQANQQPQGVLQLLG